MKQEFIVEFEIRSTPMIIFDFISTPSGLSRWFADNVDVNRNRNFVIEYDGVKRIAKKIVAKTKKTVRYEFLETEEENSDGTRDNNYVEFNIEVSNLTDSVFINIVEYCNDYDNYDEFVDIWNRLIKRLKQIIGR